MDSSHGIPILLLKPARGVYRIVNPAHMGRVWGAYFTLFLFKCKKMDDNALFTVSAVAQWAIMRG
jgi:hypothetical protein